MHLNKKQQMSQNSIKQITCPNCSEQFDVEDVLASQVEKKLKEKFELDRKVLQNKYNEEAIRLEKERADFEEKKKNENQLFKNKLSQALSAKQNELRNSIKEEFETRIKSQNEELAEKRKKLAELQQKELEIERLKIKMTEQEKDIELKYEKQLRQTLQEKEEHIVKRISEQQELKIREKDKQLEDQKKLIEEMRRRSEQGSMQLQGEVQEQAIEDQLKLAFPFDRIDEVPKGIRGADSIQTVINEQQQVCGKIIFESKRTKNFASDWIDKLKIDQRNTGAEIAVLVTEVFPKDLEKFGEYNGIYICKYNEMESLVYVLRKMLVQKQMLMSAQENKGSKMEMLYDYLTGSEFGNRITAIAETFSIMKEDLDREKRQMMLTWKKREKQIEIITNNTIALHSNVKAIGGRAIPAIDIFELPDGLSSEQ